MIESLKSKLKEEELNEVLDNLLQQAMVICGTKAGTVQLINKKKQYTRHRKFVRTFSRVHRTF
jgi:glutamine amidotransferase PdxT